MSFQSLQEIITVCEDRKIEFWQAILEDDCLERRVSGEESEDRMMRTWQAMLKSADLYDGDITSASGQAGGDGAKMQSYAKTHGKESLCGSFLNEVMAGALQMGESNACMKRIVAAPTAGSCGVLPAVLVPYYKARQKSDSDMVRAMYTAAGIGQVIAYRASISGAEGGCQAEIGSASAMAAGAMTYLQGGGAKESAHAAAIALKSLLGLVCDPVAGLVEVPCIKRNVIGAVNALSAADLVMAGIYSRIPPDQVIDAMKEIGDKMDVTLKETGRGGLAATKEAKEVWMRMHGKVTE